MARIMFRQLIFGMKVTIKSRVLFASLIFALLIGLSGWTSNNVGLGNLPDCGDSQSYHAVGCGGGSMMFASMPCQWCMDILFRFTSQSF